MFFYLIERAKEHIDNKYNIDAVSTLAYLILYSYVPNDLKFYFWAFFAIDVTITFYKKKIFDKIDEWYGEDEGSNKVLSQTPKKEIKNVNKGSLRFSPKADDDMRTTKSGYFESALDGIDMDSTSTGVMIDKMIKDSRSF